MVSLLLIVKNNKFLLLRRADEIGNFGNMFGLVGGGIEKGETPEESLKREVMEEIGVNVNGFKFLGKYPTNIFVYYLNDPEFDENNIKLNEEHTEYKFFTYHDLINSKDIIPNNIRIVNDYMTKK
jgi:mutator protein MutT